jgi:hypothetical protein
MRQASHRGWGESDIPSNSKGRRSFQMNDPLVIFLGFFALCCVLLSMTE